jgi:hypothetical protein
VAEDALACPHLDVDHGPSPAGGPLGKPAFAAQDAEVVLAARRHRRDPSV